MPFAPSGRNSPDKDTQNAWVLSNATEKLKEKWKSVLKGKMWKVWCNTVGVLKSQRRKLVVS